MVRWLDERLALSRLYEKFFRKAFPVHHSFFLGEITLFAFIVLVLTGIFLSLNYEPSIRPVEVAGETLPSAYASVRFIDSLPFGAVIRSIHHWSANIMIVAGFLHLLRILLTGAYKRPREVNWLIGLALLALAMAAAFTGYSLPFDAFSATATQIGYGIAASLPWLGNWLAQVFFGGQFPTEHSLPRLYSIHAIWLPLLIGFLIALHLLIMYLQKHSQPKYAEKVAPGKILGVPFWPQQALIMGVLFSLYVGIVAMIAGAFIAHPIEAFGPPGAVTPEVKPDWYFLWVYGILQMIPSEWGFSLFGERVGPQFIGLIIPILVVLWAVLLPFFDTRREKLRYVELPSHYLFRTSVIFGVIVFFLVSTLAAYKHDLGLSNTLLWSLLLVGPVLTTVLCFYLLRYLYSKRRRSSESFEMLRDG